MQCGFSVAVCAVVSVYVPGGEEIQGEDGSGNEVEEGDASPHEGASELLVGNDGNLKGPRSGKVSGISDSVAENEESGEDVAGDGGEKQIQDH